MGVTVMVTSVAGVPPTVPENVMEVRDRRLLMMFSACTGHTMWTQGERVSAGLIAIVHLQDDGGWTIHHKVECGSERLT